MKTDWVKFLEERGICGADAVGNMPCDNGAICNRCHADYIYRDYKSWKANRLIKLGDTATIVARGRRATGEVIYKDYDSWEDTWDIELELSDGTTARWRSAFDGGKLVEVNGREIY